MARDGRQRRRRWSTSRMILVALAMLVLAPVAGAIAGGSSSGAVVATTGCRLVSVVNGNTVDLACPGGPARHHHVMGLSSPPVLGARCLSEAWWGLRAQIALRAQVWRADTLSFVEEPRGHLVLMLADGIPIQRLVPRPPPDPCA
ncbi:hypothetical protein [Pararhodobacter sp.]|uniref:hypothetical protein n=1 Tax=Pararhodobacter sp. TaxID=2127056 RepID=UPI002FE05A6E